ncbi:MAG TPA: thioredoxin domain-containing protein [Propionibacteriaceae bacterium]|nr:thioredoxin domain-containing protein [Propionibacteriaceae bacterium]
MTVIHVTDATFDELVVKAPLPTLVDYWADWCAPCKQLSPIIEELAVAYEGRLNVVKLDTNVNPVIPTQQGVLGLPTLQLFVNGEVVKQLQGGKTKAQLIKAFDEYL